MECPSDNCPSTDASGQVSGESDKTIKPSRFKSLYRDAAFVRAVERDNESRSTAVDGETSVKSVSRASLSSLRASAPSEESLKQERRSHSTWWENVPETLRCHRRRAEWRDTTDQLRAYYYHLALREQGAVYTFTLNLRPDIEKLARKQPNPLSWLNHRITRELKAGLGRHVEWFAVVEEASGAGLFAGAGFLDRLHLHGEMAVSDNEVERARAGLRRAGGEWEEARQHQTKAVPDPDTGWSSYCVKDFWRKSALLRKFGSHFAFSFGGHVLTVSVRMRKLAQKLYERDCESLPA